MYKNADPISNSAHYVYVRKFSRLVPLSDVVNIYSTNYYKHVNVVCEENLNICNDEEGGRYGNHWGTKG